MERKEKATFTQDDIGVVNTPMASCLKVVCVTREYLMMIGDVSHRRFVLGQTMYPIVLNQVSDVKICSKITGMLLELSFDTLCEFMYDENMLLDAIVQAKEVLEQSGYIENINSTTTVDEMEVEPNASAKQDATKEDVIVEQSLLKEEIPIIAAVISAEEEKQQHFMDRNPTAMSATRKERRSQQELRKVLFIGACAVAVLGILAVSYHDQSHVARGIAGTPKMYDKFSKLNGVTFPCVKSINLLKSLSQQTRSPGLNQSDTVNWNSELATSTANTSFKNSASLQSLCRQWKYHQSSLMDFSICQQVPIQS
jgi:hypothetical protein